MSRALRTFAAWGLALATALLLDLAIALPPSAPAAHGGASATPTRSVRVTVGRPAAPYPADFLPQIPHPAPLATSPPHEGAPHLARLPRADAAALAVATRRERLAFGLYSLAIGVSVDGRRGWTGGSGWATDGGPRPHGDSPYVIGSITKTFTAAVVLQLVEEGRLSLRDHVNTILPEVPVDPGVTVGELLHHTSGIADLYNPLRDTLNADTAHSWHPQEVVAAVGGPWFLPGAGWAYSNTNYVLLGMIVERVTGHPFARALTSRILGPLELDDSGLQGTRHAPYLLAPSWATAFWTSGAMHASAADLLRWGDALYGGDVLAPATLHRMLQFTTHRYGLGAERLRVGDEKGYGHSGLLRGYTSLLMRLPERHVTLVVLAIGERFDPAVLLADEKVGGPSILELALRTTTR
jgi:D-alanyl-D-alanine carboxypeptidase